MADMPMNRSRLARERAGLSLGQACLMLGKSSRVIEQIEKPDSPMSSAEIAAMSSLYGVNPEWLTGQRERYNYAAVDSMHEARFISSHDRTVIAEFIAAMPRRD